MRLTRVLTVVALVVLLASSVSAFDGMRKGFVLGGGIGFSPYASWSVQEEFMGIDIGIEEDATGFGLNLIIGYAWDEFNMIVYEGNVVGFNSDFWNEQVVQAFNGVMWYHYFGPQGRSFFTAAGIGLYFQQVGDFDAFDPGGAYLIGAGFEFTRHVQVAAYLSGGQTRETIISFGHNHVNIMINAVAF